MGQNPATLPCLYMVEGAFSQKQRQLPQSPHDGQGLKCGYLALYRKVCCPWFQEIATVTLVDFTFQRARLCWPNSHSHSHAISSSLIIKTPQQTIVFTSHPENKDKSFHRGNNSLPSRRSSSASLPVTLKAMVHLRGFICVIFPHWIQDAFISLLLVENMVARSCIYPRGKECLTSRGTESIFLFLQDAILSSMKNMQTPILYCTT